MNSSGASRKVSPLPAYSNLAVKSGELNQSIIMQHNVHYPTNRDGRRVKLYGYEYDGYLVGIGWV